MHWPKYGSHLFWPVAILICVTDLLLTGSFHPHVERTPAADHELFIRLASHLGAGNWLGPYDKFTLVKGPGYSAWLAVCSYLGLAQVPALVGLRCVAGITLVGVLRRNRVPGSVLLALFALFAFHPARGAVVEIMRGPFYSCLMVFCFSGLLALVFSLRQGRRIELAAFGVGLTLGLMWTTRGEQQMLLPPVLVALVLGTQLRVGWRVFVRRSVWAAAIITVSCLAVSAVVETKNLETYGVAVRSEMEADFFTRAFGALVRIDHVARRRLVPVPRDARMKAYEVSPAFAELRKHLEGAIGKGRTYSGCRLAGICDDISTHFMWALRDAADAQGHHSSLRAAQSYYLQIAKEVNQACADGRLPCSGPRNTLIPIITFSDAPAILTEFEAYVGQLLRAGNVVIHPAIWPSTPAVLPRFREVTKHPELELLPTTIKGWLSTPDGNGEVEVRPLRERPGRLHPRSVDIERGPAASAGGLVERATWPPAFEVEIETTCVHRCVLVVVSNGRDEMAVPLDLLSLDRRYQSPRARLVVTKFPVEPQRLGRRVRILNWLAAAYRVQLVATLPLAFVVFVWLLVRQRRAPSTILSCSAVVLAGIGTRLVVISVVSATWFPARGRFLWPAHALVPVFVTLALYEGWREVRRYREIKRQVLEGAGE